MLKESPFRKTPDVQIASLVVRHNKTVCSDHLAVPAEGDEAHPAPVVPTPLVQVPTRADLFFKLQVFREQENGREGE
jgi:hypothetical protein